jgi:hypothetical protein
MKEACRQGWFRSVPIATMSASLKRFWTARLSASLKPGPFPKIHAPTQAMLAKKPMPSSASTATSRMIPHVRPRGEEIKAKKNKRFKPRRWIVEVAHGWFHNFRKLKVRYETSARNCLALHHIAAAFIALRRCHANNGRNIICG